VKVVRDVHFEFTRVKFYQESSHVSGSASIRSIVILTHPT
jgi:hypothetical protein